MICHLQLRTTFKPEVLRARAWGINLNLQAGDAWPGPSREAIEPHATVFCLFILVRLSVGWWMSIHTTYTGHSLGPFTDSDMNFTFTHPYRCTQILSDKQAGTDWSIQSLLPHTIILQSFWDTPRGVPLPHALSQQPSLFTTHLLPTASSQGCPGPKAALNSFPVCLLEISQTKKMFISWLVYYGLPPSRDYSLYECRKRICPFWYSIPRAKLGTEQASANVWG